MIKCVIFALLFSCMAQAQMKSELEARYDSRYDSRENGDNQRLQQRIRLGYKIDFSGKLQLVTLLSSGETFSSDWALLHNIKPGHHHPYEFPSLNFRRFYLQHETDKIQIQAGIIPTVKKYTSFTGKDESGWIDGLRLERFFEKGQIEIVAGSIGDINNPNAFTRKRELDFLEIELTREVFNNLIAEMTYERLDTGNYGQIEFKYDIESLGEEILSFTSDALVKLDNGAYGFGLGVESDLLYAIFRKYRKYLLFEVNYVNIPEEMGTRGTLNDNFNGFGEQLKLRASGQITKNNSINWFARAFIADENRFNVGLNFKFNKKFAKKAQEQ